MKEPYQRGAVDCILTAIKQLLTSRLPGPMILVMIMEIIEHSPGIAQKLIK
jgi:hypothetical protein